MSQFKDRSQAEQEFCEIYFDYAIPILNLTLAIVMIPIFWKYLKVKSQIVKKKCLFWTGSIFFVFIFLAHILWSFGSIYFCHDITIYNFINYLYTLAYTSQTFLLLAILFARLYFVFNGTAYALSPRLIKAYWIFYILTGIMFLIAGYAFANLYNTFIGLILVGLGFLFYLSLAIILMVLFIRKLIQVYKGLDSDPTLIATITKTGLLCIVSISSTILLVILTLLTPSTKSVHVNLIVGVATTNDLATNFWCTILSFKAFDHWYLKICGCCDSKCKLCWHRCAGKDADIMRKEMELSNPNEVNVKQIESTQSTQPSQEITV